MSCTGYHIPHNVVLPNGRPANLVCADCGVEIPNGLSAIAPGGAASVESYPGLPMTDADLAKHYEASKRDVVGLVGSEVRQIIGELRYLRAWTERLGGFRAWLDRSLNGARHNRDVADPKAAEILRNIICQFDAALATTSPVDAKKVRPELMAFAQLMETQLQANDRKPGWKQDEARDLMGRLYDEALELYDAVASQSIGAGPAEIVGKEAADVANFAMMIADVCGALPALATSSPVDAEKVRLREALEILRAIVWMEGRTAAQTYWFGKGRDFFAKYGEASNG